MINVTVKHKVELWIVVFLHTWFTISTYNTVNCFFRSVWTECFPIPLGSSSSGMCTSVNVMSNKNRGILVQISFSEVGKLICRWTHFILNVYYPGNVVCDVLSTMIMIDERWSIVDCWSLWCLCFDFFDVWFILLWILYRYHYCVNTHDMHDGRRV